MSAAAKGLAHSVQTRLVQHAKALGMDVNLVLSRFAVERFLYRLSRSPHADRFVLKGALLMLVWLGETIRPTRDADLLGFGELSEQTLARVFTEVCEIHVEPDGMHFLTNSVRVAPIRVEDNYGGLRATLDGRLGNARLRVQVDVGIGDAVTPDPEWLNYPGMLDLPQARIRAYRPETAIAEKLHAMVVLGAANSRMRDFFDIYALSERERFDADLLVRAVRATFERRRTPIPDRLPLALTAEFAEMKDKQLQWQGFMRKNVLSSAPADLGQTIERLAMFLGPVIHAARSDASPKGVWPPQGLWESAF
jgi:predicted nucleotidyltransferase component of viral defense system